MNNYFVYVKRSSIKIDVSIISVSIQKQNIVIITSNKLLSRKQCIVCLLQLISENVAVY